MELLKFAVIGLSVFAVGSSMAIAEEPVEFELTADYFGKYIWRGQNLSDDPVFQPGLSAGFGGLTAAIWGNMDTTNINGNSGDFSEVDYSFDYSSDLPGVDGVGYSVGLIYYDFPGTAVKDTTEAYWGLSFDLPFSPSVTVYHDLDEAEGSYVALGAGYSVEEIGELAAGVPVGLDIGASLGWGSGSYNDYYWGVDENKMQDLAVSVGFPVELGGWTVTTSLNYVALVSDDIRNTDAYGTNSDYFFAGVSLSKGF